MVSRALGMATASTNFSHRIEEMKRQEHILVTRRPRRARTPGKQTLGRSCCSHVRASPWTDGIYAWLRHPAYFGFFWFSVGTQVLS